MDSTKIKVSIGAMLLFVCWVAMAWGTVSAPVLKWQNSGCTTWCETGWYSSPTVADLDGDGTKEIIGAADSIFILNGQDGSEKKKITPPGWPGLARGCYC